jgi:CBS domain-containing protein
MERSANSSASPVPSQVEASTMTLVSATAADLMVPNPVSIRDNATIDEAITVLADKGLSAAPVIDIAGKPLGVVSSSDIIIHSREGLERGDRAGAAGGKRLPVGDIMTPAVFSVPPDFPARRVVAEMLALNVHRLFVVDDTGALVGSIEALDVLGHLW